MSASSNTRSLPLPLWSLSQAAGLVTWLAVGVPLGLERLKGPVAGTFSLWLLCYLAFGVLFALISVPRFDRWLPHRSFVPLTLLTLLTFGVLGFGAGDWLGGVLLIITASYAPHLLSSQKAALWVFGQTAVMATFFLSTGEAVNALVQTALYLGFQLFALFTTHAALSEAAARERLARLNAELLATQELLRESSQLAERVRLARELHDVIGHHLTALSLNLEVASHVAEGRALAQVRTAQAISKTLLTEVRGVVSSMREPLNPDLAGALALLCRDIPTPKVHLTVVPDLLLDDPECAQVICALCSGDYDQYAQARRRPKLVAAGRTEPRGDQAQRSRRRAGRGRVHPWQRPLGDAGTTRNAGRTARAPPQSGSRFCLDRPCPCMTCSG